MVEAFVRADAVQCGFCTPGQIVSAVALVESSPEPGRERDQAPHGGEPVPLRHYPRIEEAIMKSVARLIRTQKEVEGGREEVWLVVEEDALEQWPAGPLEVVGQPAPRVDGLERARGEATLHRRRAAARHAAHGRAALAARARAGDADRPRARARRAGRARAPGPATRRALHDECGYEGVAVAAVCAETARAGRRRGRGADRRGVGGAARRCSTPTTRSSAARS